MTDPIRGGSVKGPDTGGPWRVIVSIGVLLAFLIAGAWFLRSPTGSLLEQAYQGATFDFDPSTGALTGVRDLEDSAELADTIDTPAELSAASVEFLRRPEVAEAFGIQPGATLRVVSSFRDPQRRGYNVFRTAQYVGNLRVFGGDIVVSTRGGPDMQADGRWFFNEPSPAISSVAGRAAGAPVTDLTPDVDEAAARATAAAFYTSIGAGRGRLPGSVVVDELELLFFDPVRFRLGGEATIAWRARVEGIEMFIDGRNRRVIFAYDARPAIRNRQTRDCGNTPTCTLVLDESGNVAVPPESPDAAAQAVHDAALAAHEYFRTRFGRDGYDDALGTGGSAAIESYVRVTTRVGAFWTPWSGLFEYSDGWATTDVAAHEYAHAVTQFGPALLYSGESGAVNEFFSDFFGAMVDRFKTGATDWRIGEGVRGFSMARPLRNMADPHNGGFNPSLPYDPLTNRGAPDHYSDFVTTTDAICKTDDGLFDNACVHFNSGILNRAAVLAIDGGTVGSITVTPISIAKVERIFFHTWMAGLTPASGLKETANGVIAACEQLRGDYGIDANDCASLTQAMIAVGLR